eukprot:2904910-Pleurochrysis_carterae.AAC.1
MVSLLGGMRVLSCGADCRSRFCGFQATSTLMSKTCSLGMLDKVCEARGWTLFGVDRVPRVQGGKK